MERREIAEAMRREGKTLKEIAATIGASNTTVYKWVKHIKPYKVMTFQSAQKKGYVMGYSRDLAPGSLNVVAKKIRGNETIIACMSRLVAAMSQKKEEPK